MVEGRAWRQTRGSDHTRSTKTNSQVDHQHMVHYFRASSWRCRFNRQEQRLNQKKWGKKIRNWERQIHFGNWRHRLTTKNLRVFSQKKKRKKIAMKSRDNFEKWSLTSAISKAKPKGSSNNLLWTLRWSKLCTNTFNLSNREGPVWRERYLITRINKRTNSLSKEVKQINLDAKLQVKQIICHSWDHILPQWITEETVHLLGNPKGLSCPKHPKIQLFSRKWL